jgi:hypothetical protein
MRTEHMPEELRVLFIGESPPAGGTFFYSADSILYRATRQAFLDALPNLADQPNFLEAFRALGCYLDDLSLRPIDKLESRDRLEARDAAVPQLARRLSAFRPRRVVIVLKGIAPQVSTALEEAGLGEVARAELRFPSRWHRAEYVAELTELVRGWRGEELLLAT